MKSNIVHEHSKTLTQPYTMPKAPPLINLIAIFHPSVVKDYHKAGFDLLQHDLELTPKAIITKLVAGGSSNLLLYHTLDSFGFVIDDQSELINGVVNFKIEDCTQLIGTNVDMNNY